MTTKNRKLQNFDLSGGSRLAMARLRRKWDWSKVAVLERALIFADNPRKYKTFGPHIPRDEN